MNSSDQKDKIKVNILPYLGALEFIAKEHQKLVERSQKAGINFEGHIVSLNKSWPEVDFCEVADLAVKTYDSLSLEDEVRRGYDSELIKRGYELVTTKKVWVWRLR